MYGSYAGDSQAEAAQYPDKIRVFEYRPSVYPLIDLDEEELEKAKLLPPDSIHTLAGYCNYALSKASYRYAVKIDADQVYFTDRLKHICDAYRSDKKCGSTWRNVSLANLYRAYLDSFNRIEMRRSGGWNDGVVDTCVGGLSGEDDHPV